MFNIDKNNTIYFNSILLFNQILYMFREPLLSYEKNYFT